jgi:hypothetical protein
VNWFAYKLVWEVGGWTIPLKIGVNSRGGVGVHELIIVHGLTGIHGIARLRLN